MKSLGTFSIESDATVLLTYTDGTTRRARSVDLPQLLGHDDLKRVKAGFRLRQRFHRALPPWLKVVAIGTVALLVSVGGTKAVSLLRRPATVTVVAPAAPAAPKPSGQTLGAHVEQAVQSVQTAVHRPATTTVPAIPPAAMRPTTINLPLGQHITVPPLLPTVVKHVTEPVTTTLSSLGL